MVFEHIEQLKRDYTDKFVVVDETRPELARFRGTPGRVKTVNMNGKALVEFTAHANIGWYDIDVDFLKVVERPVPREPEKKAAPAKKPAAKAAAKPAATGQKLSPLEMARMQGAAGSKAPPTGEEKPAAAPAGGKMSTADILAAARGGKASAEPAEPPAKAAPAPPAASKDPASMSVAEKIAALRGEKAAPPAAEPPAAPESAAAEPAAEEPAAEAAGEAQPPAEEGQPAAAVDRSAMSVAEMIAWCRQQDGG